MYLGSEGGREVFLGILTPGLLGFGICWTLDWDFLPVLTFLNSQDHTCALLGVNQHRSPH